MLKSERKMLTATTLLLTLVAAGFAPGAASAQGSSPTCVGRASITVDVTPQIDERQAGKDTRVRSTVTNCGSTAATFTVQHTFSGDFGLNTGYCLTTLTPDSLTVSLDPGRSAVVDVVREQPYCVGGLYEVAGTVKESNQVVAEGGNWFSLNRKTRRNP